MLRGFGIIFTDNRYGSIFVPRYEFLPKYAVKSSKLNTLPWSTDYYQNSPHQKKSKNNIAQ